VMPPEDYAVHGLLEGVGVIQTDLLAGAKSERTSR